MRSLESILILIIILTYQLTKRCTTIAIKVTGDYLKRFLLKTLIRLKLLEIRCTTNGIRCHFLHPRWTTSPPFWISSVKLEPSLFVIKCEILLSWVLLFYQWNQRQPEGEFGDWSIVVWLIQIWQPLEQEMQPCSAEIHHELLINSMNRKSALLEREKKWRLMKQENGMRQLWR